MASVVVERVVDGIAMATVLLTALFFADFAPAQDGGKLIGQVRFWGLVILAGFVAALIFLIVAYVQRDLARRFLHAVVEPVSKKLAHKVSDMLDAFIGGLKLVPTRGKVLLFFGLTATYWSVNGLGMMLLARSFGMHLSLAQAFAVLGVLVIGVMIPAGPGMLGPFQMAIVIGTKLSLPGPQYDAPIQAYAWLVWACQFGQQALTGLAFLFSSHIKFSQLVGGGPQEGESEQEGEEADRNSKNQQPTGTI